MADEVSDAERRFRLLVEHSADGISVVDETHTIRYLSPGAGRILGLDPAELIGRPAVELVHPEDLATMERCAPGETRVYVNRGRHRDGTWRWIEATTTNLTADPSVRAYITNFRDITERYRNEAALRRSEQNFRLLIERSPTSMFVQRDGRYVYANPAMLAMLGYEQLADLVGRDIFEQIHPDDHAEIRARVARTDRDGGGPPGEVRLLRRDGSVVVCEAEGMRLDFDGEPAHVVLARDVGERRDLFARIAVADRMMTVGTLAAGVAHEINNPLAYVSANLTLIANDLRQSRPDLRDLIGDAREGVERISAIVRELRALSRPDDESFTRVDIAAVLASSIKMVHNDLRHRAKIEATVAGELPRVLANASRLGQVFLNLLVNAMQAIPEGAADRNTIHVRAWADAGRVLVDVEDTGAGIPAHIIARIFDPFYTTKPIGVGTGLGLTICHQIVHSFSGEIAVTSAPGHGSRFRVILPSAPGTPAALAPAPAITATTGLPARVLIVDDEPSLGRATKALLAPDHDVVWVTRASDALRLLAGGDRFDVILCDLMMPEMSGMEFHAQLEGRAPEYVDRVLFMTGGAFTSAARAFLDNRPHVAKPFTEVELRRAIERVAQRGSTIRP